MTGRRIAACCFFVLLALFPTAWIDTSAQTAPAPAGAAGLLRAPAFRNLGPARQNGRILHVMVDERRPSTFYVVPSTGGLWKTVNNGTTFDSVLPDKSMVSIGHAALAPSNPDIIWVGHRRRGVWTHPDSRLRCVEVGRMPGKTWAHMGLTETRHVGRIAIDPRNPDIVYVAAVGYHFSNGPDRGLYKTIDGGKTWSKVLFKGDHVGVVDVVIDPKNPNTVFAVTYDKQRIPWNFDEGGPETGIYRSKDAGKTWQRLAGRPADGQARALRHRDLPEEPVDHVRGHRQPEPAAGARRRIAAAAWPAAPVTPARPLPIGGEVYRSDDGGQHVEEDERAGREHRRRQVVRLDLHRPEQRQDDLRAERQHVPVGGRREDVGQEGPREHRRRRSTWTTTASGSIRAIRTT